MCRTISLLVLCLHFWVSKSFLRTVVRPSHPQSTSTLRSSTNGNLDVDDMALSRRRMIRLISSGTAVVATATMGVHSARAEGGSKSFTPGGTLVEFEVGTTVGNPEASPSRKVDNSNVIFTQDFYFKFGTAAPWIGPGSTEFPKSMPFVPSQQRYDSLKKYGEKVKAGARVIHGLGDVIQSGGDISDPSLTEYALRPMGLLANGFMASENTGTTNELFLARWYINEIYLLVGDARMANNKEDAMRSYDAAEKAANSYLGMLNRSIPSKVGDKFDLL